MWKLRPFRASKAESAAAQAHRQEAMEKASVAIDQVTTAAFFEATRDQDLAAFTASGGTELLLYFERHYLWGLFAAHSATVDFPTAAIDRTQILLVNWLVQIRQHTFDDALEVSRQVRAAFNAADPAHDFISSLGARTYVSPDEGDLATTVKWLMASRS